jgi:hypothetical protein
MIIRLLITLCSTTPNASGVRSFVLAHDRVTFTVPAYWGVAGPDVADSIEGILFCIPNPATEGTADAANVAVEIISSHQPLNLRSYSDAQLRKLARVAPVKVLVDSTWVGARIVARRSQQGPTLFSLNDLYAVNDTILVHCFVALPTTTRIPSDWYHRVASELDDVLASFKVDARVLFPDVHLRFAPR